MSDDDETYIVRSNSMEDGPPAPWWHRLWMKFLWTIGLRNE